MAKMPRRMPLREKYKDILPSKPKATLSENNRKEGAERKRRSDLYAELRDALEDLGYCLERIPESQRFEIANTQRLSKLISALFFQPIYHDEVKDSTKQFRSLMAFYRISWTTLWGLNACRNSLKDVYQEELFALSAKRIYELLHTLMYDAYLQLQNKGVKVSIGLLPSKWDLGPISKHDVWFER